MVALFFVLLCCVVVLGVLVAGLLRSHADILRALHDLGVGVGDPSSRASNASNGTPVPLTMGPPMARDRHRTDVTDVTDVVGVTPAGDAVSVSLRSGSATTLLAFLSSGCATCAGIWAALADTKAAGLPADVRVVAVTKGPQHEIAGEVAAAAPPGVLVVMSGDAWSDYEVPASPFFVLVDGAGRRIGEGVAPSLVQVADLVRRATVDGGADGHSHRAPARLDGPAREAENDRLLRRAGVLPGHASLYPQALADVFGGTADAVGTAGTADAVGTAGGGRPNEQP